MDFLSFLPAETVQAILATCIGLLMGLERARKHKSASVRTFALVSLGSCIFTILSVEAAHLGSNSDPTRISSNIVTGIGFLAGGVIFKQTDRPEGITTGAMVWLSAALGMACGFNFCSLAIMCSILYFLILFIGSKMHKLVD